MNGGLFCFWDRVPASQESDTETESSKAPKGWKKNPIINRFSTVYRPCARGSFLLRHQRVADMGRREVKPNAFTFNGSFKRSCRFFLSFSPSRPVGQI